MRQALLLALCFFQFHSYAALMAATGSKKLPEDEVWLFKNMVSKAALGELVADKAAELRVENPELEGVYVLPVLSTRRKPADLTLYLATKEKIVDSLRPLRLKGKRWEFKELVDVNVHDVNGDGYSDLLILARFTDYKIPPFLLPLVFLNDQKRSFRVEQPADLSKRDSFANLADFRDALRNHYQPDRTGRERLFEKFALPTDCTAERLMGDQLVFACVRPGEGQKKTLAIKLFAGGKFIAATVIREVGPKEEVPRQVEVQWLHQAAIAVAVARPQCREVQVLSSMTGRVLGGTGCESGRFCKVRAVPKEAECALWVDCGDKKVFQFSTCQN